LLGEIARRLQPETTEAEALSLAGAPSDLAALRAYLFERFGLEYSVKQLQAFASVTPEMLTPPAERKGHR
jgi:hypothetical protein